MRNQKTNREKNIKTWFSVVFSIFILICAACSEQSEDAGEKKIEPDAGVVANGDKTNMDVKPEGTANETPKGNEPLTFRFLDMANMSESVFQKEVAEPLAKKYPHFVLQYVQFPGNIEIKSYFAANPIPDIIYAPLKSMDALIALEILANIPSKFFPSPLSVTAAVKQFNSDGTPVAVGAEAIGPRPNNFGMMKKYENGALYYNIDLFDKFGVDYPWEGITWNETFDLAKKLTREEGGMFYQGFQSDYVFLMDRHSLYMPYYDPQTKQSNMGKEEWNHWLVFLKSFYDILGNEFHDESMEKTRNRFAMDQTIAMWAGNYIYPPIPKNTFNWDMVSLPNLNKGTHSKPAEWNSKFFGIGNTQMYEEESAALIATLFSNPGTAGGGGEIKQEFKKVLLGMNDVNSAIRQAEEMAELNRKKESGG